MDCGLLACADFHGIEPRLRQGETDGVVAREVGGGRRCAERIGQGRLKPFDEFPGFFLSLVELRQADRKPVEAEGGGGQVFMVDGHGERQAGIDVGHVVAVGPVGRGG